MVVTRTLADLDEEVTIPQLRSRRRAGVERLSGQGELAFALGVTMPTARRSYDRLIRNGLVQGWPDLSDSLANVCARPFPLSRYVPLRSSEGAGARRRL